jgi:hypothetical protein
MVALIRAVKKENTFWFGATLLPISEHEKFGA